ncbi:hypothetical protein ALC56_01664, partial [Trachymyrmex septentrionalis]
ITARVRFVLKPVNACHSYDLMAKPIKYLSQTELESYNINRKKISIRTPVLQDKYIYIYIYIHIPKTIFHVNTSPYSMCTGSFVSCISFRIKVAHDNNFQNNFRLLAGGKAKLLGAVDRTFFLQLQDSSQEKSLMRPALINVATLIRP